MLTNKYRPKDIMDMIPTIDTLSIKNSVENGDFPNLALFYGPNGVGKTTMARWIASKVLELDTDDADSLIHKGSHSNIPNYVEYDFTINGGARDVDVLAAQIKDSIDIGFLAQQEKYVFVLDEFTHASGGTNKQQSLNTQKKLAKVVEDTEAENVYIIIITNELNRVEMGIISRAMPFEFTLPPKTFSVKLIQEISKKEGKTVDSKIAENIYLSVNDPSPRKLLVALEQYLLYGKIDKRAETVDTAVSNYISALNELAKLRAQYLYTPDVTIELREISEKPMINKLYAAIGMLISSQKTLSSISIALANYYSYRMTNARETSTQKYDAVIVVAELFETMNDKRIDTIGYMNPFIEMIRISYHSIETRSKIMHKRLLLTKLPTPKEQKKQD